ncbi:MAG: carboxypeptidase-like regulatory domain-containing protein [Candidatus Acidiferrales bacterium]
MRIRATVQGFLVCLLVAAPLWGQSRAGELRLKVTDTSGLGVRSHVELVSEANHFQQTLMTDDDGYLVAMRLSFGFYPVEVRREGFTPFTQVIQVRSAVPAEFHVTLSRRGIVEGGRQKVVAASRRAEHQQPPQCDQFRGAFFRNRRGASPQLRPSPGS